MTSSFPGDSITTIITTNNVNNPTNENTPLVDPIRSTTTNTTATAMSTSPLVPRDDNAERGDGVPLLDRGRDSDSAEREAVGTLDPADVAYSANSFMAVLKPVTLTMVLSAAITVSLYSDTEGATNSALSMYEVYHESSNTVDTSRVRLGKSLINALMIVLVLAGATGVIVLMYWLRCMKCLWGYMAFSSAVLLGLMGGAVWQSALDVFQIPCDMFSFYGVLWNFAAVGVLAIFYKKGIPTVVTQGYLVCTSVIMAWQLSRFEEWTGWCLLVVLALYDLCAVLSPCGPLKALVHLMQKYDDPMPGLLYEAELPAGSARRRLRVEEEEQPQDQQDAAILDRSSIVNAPPEVEQEGIVGQHQQQQHGEVVGGGPERVNSSSNSNSSSSGFIMPTAANRILTGGGDGDEKRQIDESGAGSSRSPSSTARSGVRVPRSLELVGSANQARSTVAETAGDEATAATFRGEQLLIEEDLHSGEAKDEEALIGTREEEERRLEGREDISVHQRPEGQGGSPRSRGRVDYSTAQDVDDDESVSIKLGLGDFVFYSVLVTKAALYGFTAWAVCTLVIVFGLGATLVLLSVYRMALPALPISIGLGTIFFLLTRFSIQPYVEALNETPLYF